MRFVSPQTCIVAILLPFALVAPDVGAGTFNPDRSIGDVVPAWRDLVGTDGKTHSWDDVRERDAVVVVFTCNTCPYAIDYEQRINDLARRHAAPDSRVAVVAINANDVPEDRLPAMTARAKAGDFRFSYLSDPTGEVARSFGAVRTPECFLLDRDRRIVYMGAIDDSADPDRVAALHLANAIDALLAARPVAVAETAPVGCMIRYARSGKRDRSRSEARPSPTVPAQTRD